MSKSLGFTIVSNSSERELARLSDKASRLQKAKAELTRHLIAQGRVDVLAELVGYYVKDFHQEMWDYQSSHHRAMILAWRGSGKTTICTILRAVLEILRNRDVRILIASKNHNNAAGMLEEIKGILVHSVIRELYGDLVGDKWETLAISVKGCRKKKEHTIDTTGVESALPSRHWDIIIADDLVDEGNSRTPYQREKLKTWFYKTLMPCLAPNGKLWILGTLYHPEDLYHHLEQTDMKGRTLKIPVLDENGRSRWEEMFPTKDLLEMRSNMGTAIFDSQFMMRSDAMISSTFDWNSLQNFYLIREDTGGLWFVRNPHTYGESKTPFSQGVVFMGVDLATGTVGAGGSQFACVVIAIDPDRYIYVRDADFGLFPFLQQLRIVSQMARKHKPVAIFCESNSYQRVFVDTIRRSPEFQDLRGISIVPVNTKLGKSTRILKRTADFESGRIFFLRSQKRIIEALANTDPDREGTCDLFDALDLAIEGGERMLNQKMVRGSGRGGRRYHPDIFWNLREGARR